MWCSSNDIEYIYRVRIQTKTNKTTIENGKPNMNNILQCLYKEWIVLKSEEFGFVHDEKELITISLPFFLIHVDYKKLYKYNSCCNMCIQSEVSESWLDVEIYPILIVFLLCSKVAAWLLTYICRMFCMLYGCFLFLSCGGRDSQRLYASVLVVVVAVDG